MSWSSSVYVVSMKSILLKQKHLPFTLDTHLTHLPFAQFLECLILILDDSMHEEGK